MDSIIIYNSGYSMVGHRSRFSNEYLFLMVWVRLGSHFRVLYSPIGEYRFLVIKNESEKDHSFNLDIKYDQLADSAPLTMSWCWMDAQMVEGASDWVTSRSRSYIMTGSYSSRIDGSTPTGIYKVVL